MWQLRFLQQSQATISINPICNADGIKQLQHSGANIAGTGAGAVQVREYMDRMVKADGEASKAQADANRAQKALRQLETDVDALRCASIH